MTREQADTRTFVSILSEDGTFRINVPEGTEGAVARDWSVGNDSGTKHELAFKALTAKVTKVETSEATFDRDGKKVKVKFLQVTLLDSEGELTLSLPVGNSFAQSLMKQLPNMDFAKEYRFAPFSFTNDKGKEVKGISITEGSDKEKKVGNFFYDSKEEKNVNGFPEPEGDTKKYTSNKWKAYFGEVEDFLVGYIEENIVPKFAADASIEEDAVAKF